MKLLVPVALVASMMAMTSHGAVAASPDALAEANAYDATIDTSTGKGPLVTR
ncbi:hypothetical protein EV174_006190, partial [Coemansia sp. RSA 2320]